MANLLKISLIIPCYNAEQYIEDCIGSVRASVGKCRSINVEIICVDDGSKDGTGKLLDDLATRDSCLRVIHQKNSGEGAARNTGLAVATGDWLMYLDSDDLLALGAFETLVRAFERYPETDIVAYQSIVFNDGATVDIDMPSGVDGDCHAIDIRHEIPNVLAEIAVWQMVYRASVFRDLRFGDCVMGADLVYTSACFGRAASVVIADGVCHAYRVRANSMAHCALSVRKMRDTIRYHQAMFENLQKSGKTLGAAFWRSRGNGWIEGCGAELLRHCDAEWQECWYLWLTSMSVCSHMCFFSPWQRFVARSCALTRCRLVVFILCSVLLYLKRHGIHR